MRQLLVARFWLPPLLRVQSPLERIFNIALPPVVWGLLCGLLSGADRAAYAVGLALSVVGAFAAGRQQLGARAGLLRGIVAGTIFAAFVLVGHAVFGVGARFLVPIGLQVGMAAALGGTFAAWGAWSR